MDFSYLLDPRMLISSLGAFGVIVIIFLETGAFFGIIFPGDSLLFTAGFLSSIGYLPLTPLLLGSFVAAVLGDSVGYAFGKKIGPALFTKEDSLIFNRKYIAEAEHFYEKQGRKTIILARFLPIIRTFAPIVAGIGSMHYRTFLIYNVVGAFLWTWSMLWLGYGLGAIIPDPDRYVIPVIAVIVVVSALPALIALVRKKDWKLL